MALDTPESTAADAATLAAADAAAEALIKGGLSTRPEVSLERSNDLDEAFAEASGAPPAADDPENIGLENNESELSLQVEAEAEKKALAEETARKTAAAASAAPVKVDAPAAEKGLLDDLVAETGQDPAKSGQTSPPSDPYGDVKLRSDASPKTRETFEALKTVAKQREEAARKEAEEARAESAKAADRIKELEAKVVPDDVRGELKELREFRAQFDTQNDPQFKAKFDVRVDKNYEAVYAKLRSHALPESEIEKLRAFPPADRDAAIENFFGKLPAMSKRFIEAKLLDNINVTDERERALQEARDNAAKILAERKSAPGQQTQAKISEVAKLVQPELAKLPWIHTKEIPANAAPEDKKRIEAENTAALDLQERLKSAIVDESPAGRARSALAVPLARHYSSLYVQEHARAEALQKQLDAIKSASTTSRTARTIASPSNTVAPRATPTDSGEAFDALFAEVTNARR
jgi:hypothetical protein